ncbi:cysteine proteinase [Fistulina hepatica ATCC 64428]|uniref:Ubiquitin carboxyl-terminal hydrolase n=1 Tax=Fistulina hepatica ATCC 64428 TaxID=1128425 RepID=A0A0D7ANJ8_9AGAR|nr:cysteine proteinase [Fistulina hepatica ATCC 64428]
MAGRWIPLESNPDWAEKAGLVTSLAKFGDIYGLDDELLALVPQPVHAVILLFPITQAYEEARKEEDEIIEEDGQPFVDPTIVWIKQTIGNACGTIGMLHALINSPVTFTPESPLAQFIDQCKGITPEERAKVLETTPLFANIHAEAATEGQSAVPSSSINTDLHFTCFIKAPSAPDRQEVGGDGSDYRLIELDGRRGGPVDRGDCTDTDLLSAAIQVVRSRLVLANGSVSFSMIALSGTGNDGSP